MRVYGDLIIHHSGLSFPALVDALSAKLPTGWSRCEDHERKTNELGSSNGICFTFAGSESPALPSASVWLFPRDTNTAYVSNIVPSGIGQLSHAEYNDILTMFHQQITVPVASQMELQTELTRTGEVGLRDFVSEPAARALERFSSSANKATGSSHPMDNRRWNDFIIATHADDQAMPTDILRRWLIEDGWDPESAMDLVIEFEHGRDLLKQYVAA